MVEVELEDCKFQTIRVDDATGNMEFIPGIPTKQFTVPLPGGLTLEMVRIPGGTFTMGSPEDETVEYERPQRQVQIPTFYMAKYQLTEKQWESLFGLPAIAVELETRPNYDRRENLPIGSIHWEEAVEWLRRLENYTGLLFRLPSEAEWEYACRGGTTTPYYWGKTQPTPAQANFRHDGWRCRNPVGMCPPNPFGLYDMAGNMWEWCADNWICYRDPNYEFPINHYPALHEGRQAQWQMKRGGSYASMPWECRSACRRGHYDITNWGSLQIDVTLRVACSTSIRSHPQWHRGEKQVAKC